MTLLDALQELLGPSFEVRRELGGGGMSRVFVAFEPALKREVVVKVLPPDLLSTTSVARFRKEIEVTAHLQHPHILPVISAGGNESLLYYVVPYLAGASLADRLAKGPRLAFSECVRIASEVLAALGLAHQRGITHRDVKPSNVLLSDGHAVLADFGIAAVRDMADGGSAGAPPTGPSSVATPAAYLAPERPRDAAADLYAVAVLTYEMLTATLPPRVVSTDTVAGTIAKAHPGIGAEQVRAVGDALTRALSTDPARRFASAADLRSALAERSGAGNRLQQFSIAAGIVAIAAVGLGSWWIIGHNSVPMPTKVVTAPAPVFGDTVATTLAKSIANGQTLPADTVSSSRPPKTIPEADPAPKRPVSLSVLDSGLASMSADPQTAHETLRRVPEGSPDYSRAQLHLALLSGWTPASVVIEATTTAATRALQNPTSLDEYERAMADGLVALGNFRYPEACAAFDRARAERIGYHPWMGLAECRTRDSLVIRDPGGSFRFRSSYYEAAKAYQEAIRRAPEPGSPLAYQRLASVAFTEPTRLRRGFDEENRLMFGYLAATPDSFTFDVAPAGASRRSPEQTASAVRAATLASSVVGPALVVWIRRSPNEFRAHEMLAELLEVMGNIREPTHEGFTALGEVVKARALTSVTGPSLQLARHHLRLLLRARDFAGAARLADTLQSANFRPTPAEAEYLLGAAMVSGKVSRAIDLLEQVSGAVGARQIRLPDGRALALHPAAIRERASFVVWATLGVCHDQVRAEPQRLASMLDALFPGGTKPRGVEAAFLERPLALAIPCVGREGARVISEPTTPILRAMLRGEGGDLAAYANELATFDRLRAAGAAPIMSTETAFSEAYLRLSAGDSSGAEIVVSRVLDALPSLAPTFFNVEANAGTLPRVMMLRAELALANGDQVTARRWAAAVVDLWSGADSELQPVVARMRQIAGGGR